MRCGDYDIIVTACDTNIFMPAQHNPSHNECTMPFHTSYNAITATRRIYYLPFKKSANIACKGALLTIVSQALCNLNIFGSKV